jgi:molecular chaperone DnaK (HSP70)
MVNMRRDMSQHSGESWVTKPVYQLGIDLGTAFTRTAVFRNGVEIVPHEGQSMMPSCVAFTARYRPSMLPCHAFTERSRLVGLAASLQADINPSNTIFGVLRFIGQKYSDPKIQQIAKKSPFPIVDHNGGPAFVIDRHSPDEWNVTPVEIVALILCKARTDAQTYLGTEQCTNGAVITVPVSFTFPQRQAIRDAALVAGFTETRVISTPITICADYLITKPPNNFKNVLVVDLGAGYLDIAIVGIADGKIELKATDGDQNLGGEFVNDHLVRLPSKDTKYPHHQLSSLRTLCEKAKCNLSSHQQVLIRTSSWDGPDVTYAISREELFDCCKIIVSKLAKRIISVVLEAGLKSSDIDIAIITGGTSRILSIQRTLERLLDKLEIWMNPRSDEAASSGAAYLASVLFSKNTTGGFLVDAVPASINIHIADVYTFNVFRKNAAIPSNNKLMLTETGDTRGSRLVGLYEGEKTPVGNNTLIGMLPVPKPATKAVSQTEMWMEYTVDGKIIFGTGIDFLAIHDNQRARTPQRIVLNDLIGLPEQERTSMGERTSVFEFHEKLRLVKIETETYIMSLLDRLSLHLSTDAPYLQSRIWAIADRSLAWLCGHSFQATYMNYRSQKDRLESLEAELVSRFPNLAYLRPGEIDTSLRRVSNITRPLASRPYLMLPNPVPLVPPEPEVDIESEMPIAQIRDNTEDKSLRVSVSNSWPFKDPYDGETIRGPKDQHIHSTQKSKDLVVTQVHAKTPSSHQSMLQGAGAFKSVPVSASPPSASISTICQKLSARADKPQPTDIGITSIFTRKSAESSVITDTELLQISTYLRNTGQHVLSTIPRLYAVLRLLNQLEMIAIFIEQEMTDIWFPFSLASLPSTLSPTTRARFLEQQAIVLSKSLLFETNPERKHAHFAQDDSLPFQVVAKLGSGTHGQVDKVMSTVSHREYARKQFRRRRGTSKDAIKSFFVELQVLKRVQHAHCIELVSVARYCLPHVDLVDIAYRCTATRIPNTLYCS